MTDLQAVLFVGVWCAAIWGCVYSWYRIFASIKRDIKEASNAYTGVAPTVHVARSPLGRITSRHGLRRMDGATVRGQRHGIALSDLSQAARVAETATAATEPPAVPQRQAHRGRFSHSPAPIRLGEDVDSVGVQRNG